MPDTTFLSATLTLSVLSFTSSGLGRGLDQQMDMVVPCDFTRAMVVDAKKEKNNKKPPFMGTKLSKRGLQLRVQNVSFVKTGLIKHYPHMGVFFFQAKTSSLPR